MTTTAGKHPVVMIALFCAALSATAVCAGPAAREPAVAPAEVVRLDSAADVRVPTKNTPAANGMIAPHYEKAMALRVADITGRQMAWVYMLASNPGYDKLRNDILGGKKIRFGDCLKIAALTNKPFSKVVLLDSAAPYALTYGEDRPGVYIFQESAVKAVGPDSATFVTARKLGRDYSFVVVPTVKNAQGKLDANQALLAKLQETKANDLISIQPKGQYGQSIGMIGLSKYVPPERAAFVELRKESGDGEEHYAAVLKKADTELKMLVPKSGPASGPAAKADKAPASASDRKILTALTAFKKGAAVEFIAAPADGADGVLENIAAAPPPPVDVMVAADTAAAGGSGGGGDCIGYIAVGTFRSYVAGYQPVVADNAVGYIPIIGTVGTGSVLTIVDAVIEVRK